MESECNRTDLVFDKRHCIQNEIVPQYLTHGCYRWGRTTLHRWLWQLGLIYIQMGNDKFLWCDVSLSLIFTGITDIGQLFCISAISNHGSLFFWISVCKISSRVAVKFNQAVVWFPSTLRCRVPVDNISCTTGQKISNAFRLNWNFLKWTFEIILRCIDSL